MPSQVDILQFVADRSPKRVIVFDASLGMVYLNPAASRFIERYRLPEEIAQLVKRVFAAIALGKAAELMPGQIRFWREIGGRKWAFLVEFREGGDPLVGLYFSEVSVASGIDMNALRDQYGLTRRESDALRHVLDGLSNQEIAEELGIARQTVKDYLGSIYGKVGVQDRNSLLRRLLSPQ